MTESSEIFKQAETLTDVASIRQLSCVDAIRERRGDVVCFNPGLLVTCGQMPVDPVREFATRFDAPDDLQPFCVILPPHTPPFFDGIGVSRIKGVVVDWDRRLYCIAKSRAQLCFDFLGGVGLKGANFFASSVQQEIDIPDPTTPLFKNNSIHVYVFGVLKENTITYISVPAVGVPVVAVTPAAPHIELSSKFKVNPFTGADFKKLLE